MRDPGPTPWRRQGKDNDMADIYGTAFSGTDRSKLAPGTSHDAGIRRHRNSVSLATEGGGTQNSLIIGKVREGNCIDHFRVSSDVDLSGRQFTIGVDGAPAKYCAAFAGPAANTTVVPPVVTAQLAADALATPDTIKLFPAAALPGAGLIVTSAYTSKR
jgi:hypothetical protein